MTTSPEVRAEARQFVPWLIAAPLLGVASWIYDGIYIGALLTRQMLRAMVLSVTIYAAALFVLIPAYGNHGLWAALMVLFIARALTLWRASPAIAAKARG
jgi:MATE family multidrug resistance protein